VVPSYSAGDFIKSLDDTDIQAPAETGMALVVDEYGNETPAEIRNGGVWATGETVATTEAGAAALGVPWTVATD